MMPDSIAHSQSTGHSVVLNVKAQDQRGASFVVGYSTIWIDWMCLACPARGGYGASS